MIFPDFVAHVTKRKDRGFNRIFANQLNRGHFYDMTALNWDQLDGAGLMTSDNVYLFAPSQVTIMEMVLGGSLKKHALFFVWQTEDERIGVSTVFENTNGQKWGMGPMFSFVMHSEGGYDWQPFIGPDWPPNQMLEDQEIDKYVGTVCAMLYSLNKPHTRVDKSWGLMTRQKVRGYGGAFFHGYTEVVIQDRVIRRGDGYDSGIRKCMHYVKGHIRHFKTGKTVNIPEHWRGDAKLGVKDHRYRVKPSRKPKG